MDHLKSLGQLQGYQNRFPQLSPLPIWYGLLSYCRISVILTLLQSIMEKNRRMDQSKDQTYIRWLQRILLEKQKELANINNNIRVEETKYQYQDQLKEKEAQLESLRHQIQIKDSLINKLLRTEDRKQSKTERTMQETDNLPMASTIGSDRQLMKELKKNQKKFEEAKEGIARLAQQVQTLKQELLEEQRKNQALQQDMDTLKQEKEALKNQLDKSRLADLKNTDKLTQLNNELTKLHSSQNSSSEQLKMVRQQLEQQREKRQLLETRWEQQRTVYERELHRQREDNTKQLVKQQEAKNKIIERLKEEIEGLTRVNEQIIGKRQELRHQLQLIKIKYSVLQNQLQTAKEDSLLISNRCIEPKADMGHVTQMTQTTMETPQTPPPQLTHKLSEANKTISNMQQQIATLLSEKQTMLEKYSDEKSENTKKFRQLTEEITNLRKSSEEISQQLEKSRKTTMDFIKQKQSLSSQIEHLKSSIKLLTNDVDSLKKSYKTSSWFIQLCQFDRTLNLKIDSAVTSWQMRYIICQNIVRTVQLALNNQRQLSKIVQILKNTPVGDIPLVEYLLLVCQHVMMSKIFKSTTQLIESQANIQSFMLEMSHIVMEDKINKQEEALHQMEKRQDILLNDLEKQIQDNPSQVQMSARTDVSEIRENLNMVKAVNQQLFGQIQAKQQQLNSLMKKLKSIQDFNLKQQHLKSSLKNAMKEMKTSDKAFTLISKACSLLQT